jgi:hypothetical protein
VQVSQEALAAQVAIQIAIVRYYSTVTACASCHISYVRTTYGVEEGFVPEHGSSGEEWVGNTPYSVLCTE